MKQLALALTLALAAAPAPAATAVDRTFTVTGFDRIRVDGPYRVTLTTNVPPFARAHGDPAAVNGVAIDVQGRTLVVHPATSSWGGYPGKSKGPVEIMLGTHELGTAWVNGSGLLAIDRIKGLKFDLTVQGAGSAAVGQAAVDQLNIGLAGSGAVKIAGTAGTLRTVVAGTSALEGAGLTVKDAVISSNGASTVLLTVTGTAKIDTQGVGMIDLSGGPACQVKAKGSAVVAGCR